jgi:hypothetical protein
MGITPGLKISDYRGPELQQSANDTIYLQVLFRTTFNYKEVWQQDRVAVKPILLCDRCSRMANSVRVPD